MRGNVAVDRSRVYHITVPGGGVAADTAIPVPFASFFELRCQVKVSPVRLRKSSVRKMQSAERAGCRIGVHSAHHEMNVPSRSWRAGKPTSGGTGNWQNVRGPCPSVQVLQISGHPELSQLGGWAVLGSTSAGNRCPHSASA